MTSPGARRYLPSVSQVSLQALATHQQHISNTLTFENVSHFGIRRVNNVRDFFAPPWPSVFTCPWPSVVTCFT
jgi:hypothetical protein